MALMDFVGRDETRWGALMSGWDAARPAHLLDWRAKRTRKQNRIVHHGGTEDTEKTMRRPNSLSK